jgi:biopolymer transport protein ExbD
MADQTNDLPISDPQAEAEYAARKAKRSRRKKKADEGAASVNINSMMDMMVIILCFLLKSYGSEPINITQSDDLRLTFSSTMLAPEDMLVLTVSRNQILVADESVVEIRDGQIDASNLQGANLAVLPRLEQRIREEMERQSALQAELRARGANVGADRRVITIVCDHRTPYRILSMVMATASSAGVTEFKFGVLQRPQGSPSGGG